jgi:hypothetical protein
MPRLVFPAFFLLCGCPYVTASDLTERLDLDGDGFVDAAYGGDDCADGTPGAQELCDGVDNDCDGVVDEADASDALVWYADSDGDGAGDPEQTVTACEAPDLHVANTDDCDDDDADTYLGSAANEQDSAALCTRDADGDGWGDLSPNRAGVDAGTDCDDQADFVYPGAVEVCDGADNDCDDLTDDADDDLDTTDASVWYSDADGDNFGNQHDSVLACDEPANYTDNQEDCDDGDGSAWPGAAGVESATACMRDKDKDGWGDDDPANGVEAGTDCNDGDIDINPSATEICDQVDNDCDNEIDDDDNDVDLGLGSTYYLDADGDDYGDDEEPLQACTDPQDYAPVGGDCDDDDAYTFPGAAENESTSACKRDLDGDGYGDEASISGVTSGLDCDDDDEARYPTAIEVCDGLENDCDGLIDDEDDNMSVDDIDKRYPDEDDDGYGDQLAASVQMCDPPGSYVLDNTDCDDNHDETFPGAAEEDDTTDCMRDADDDGYGDDVFLSSDILLGTDCDDEEEDVNPDADEICNEVDDNCNDLTDDEDEDIESSTQTDWYLDEDDDSFGDKDDAPDHLCEAPAQHVEDNTDCDDGDIFTFPGAAEFEDTSCRTDADEDGYGLQLPKVGVTAGTDCNDADEFTYLGAAEEEPLHCFRDADEDGWGEDVYTKGSEPDGTDCDDTDPNTHPGKGELESDTTRCVTDVDGDGYGDRWPTADALSGTDCDDVAIDRHPWDDTVVAVPADFSTIQQAIDVACAGDNIDVAAGTFSEDLDMTEVWVAVQGQGIGTTTIDGTGTGSVVNLSHGSLSDLTVTGGYSNQGGGIYLPKAGSGTTVHVSNVEVTGNFATGDGGGIYSVNNNGLVLTDVEITDNEVVNPDECGGGIYVGTGLTATGLVVDGNSAPNGGGMCFAVTNSSIYTTILSDVSVTNNSATDEGGGVWANFLPGSWSTLTVEGNEAARYGGLFLDNLSSFTLADITVAGNTGADPGMYLQTTETGTATLERAGIWRNVGSEDGDAALHLGRDMIARAVVVADNTASTAVRLSPVIGAQRSILENAAVVGNSGDGVTLVDAGADTAVMVNTAVVGHGVGVVTEGEHPAVEYCAFYANDQHSDGFELSPIGSDGNIEEIPAFFAWNTTLPSTSWNLHLTAGSGLLGAGDPVVYNSDASTSDIGAFGGAAASYEYYVDSGDSDGMWDGWEAAHGLNPEIDDSTGDLDGDGLTNAQEFTAGTRPDLVDTDGDGDEDDVDTEPLIP